jgi:hypothetical protein
MDQPGPVHQDHRTAFGTDPLGHFLANTLGGARHDGYLAGVPARSD